VGGGPSRNHEEAEVIGHRARVIPLVLAFAAAAAAVAMAGGGRAEAPSGEASGSDWPRWRGPDATGVSREKGWTTRNLDPLRIAWQTPVGTGFSGMSVVGDRLYTMGTEGGNEGVVCLDAVTGRRVWSHSYPSSLGEYPGPRVTPTVDGERVYALGQFGTLVCLDRARGSVIWQKDVVRDLGASKPSWGFAGSPVAWEDLLLLNAGRSGMAVRKDTGELVWGERGTGGYAGVVAFATQGKTLLAVFGERALYGVEPRSGAVVWSFPWVTAYDVNAADPLVVGERLFITSDYGRGCALLAVRPDGVEPVWQNTSVSSHFSSPVYLEGAIFANDGDASAHRGAFVCLDPASGEERWRERAGVGSVLAAGDRLLLLTERGQLRVAEASATAYRELASADLPAGLYWNSPVLSRGRLYVRGMKGDVYCIDLRG
jgi:outer membrane protein assembly factor BamB